MSAGTALVSSHALLVVTCHFELEAFRAANERAHTSALHLHLHAAPGRRLLLWHLLVGLQCSQVDPQRLFRCVAALPVPASIPFTSLSAASATALTPFFSVLLFSYAMPLPQALEWRVFSILSVLHFSRFTLFSFHNSRCYKMQQPLWMYELCRSLYCSL